MCIIEFLPYVPIIVPIITIISLVLNYLHRKSDKIRRIIIYLIKTFIDPAIEKLMIDSKPSEFEFPEILNYPFGIFTTNGYKRFIKTKRIMGWRVRKYNDFCNEITEKISELTNKTKELGIIEYITDANGYHPDLVEKYEDFNNEQIEDLLDKKGLGNYKKEINELLDELADKSQKLCKKLEKLRDRWIRRYYLLKSDF